jgi:mannitol-1-/sugar-/sorbitol-6-phosphatase
MSSEPSPQVLGVFGALLLDMDGTLVNSDAVVERVWRRWAAAKGVDADEVLRIAHGRQAHVTMAEVFPERPSEVNYAENDALLAEETADTEGVVPVPGATAFMAALAGLPHALVTSADVGLADARMAAAGLPMPEVRITAESVSASKPDPEGFLKGAAELGHAPADCLVLEDSGAGIAAALAAGMTVVGVGERAERYGPSAHVPDLTRLTVEALPDGAGVRVSRLP